MITDKGTPSSQSKIGLIISPLAYCLKGFHQEPLNGEATIEYFINHPLQNPEKTSRLSGMEQLSLLLTLKQYPCQKRRKHEILSFYKSLRAL
jgi:hypothetical protein